MQPKQNPHLFTAVALQVLEIIYKLRLQRRSLVWSDTQFFWHCSSRELQFAVHSKNSLPSVTG